jgi:L-iditol 2-dehydrogenase
VAESSGLGGSGAGRSGGSGNAVVRLHGPGDLRLADEPLPQLPDGEVLLRVTAVGLCGSDLHWYSEGGIGDARLTRPLVLGHEFSGVVESGARRGERVAADPAVPCGRCELCRGGDPNLCEEARFAGHTLTDGALRRYMAWPEEHLHALPEALSNAEGALLEPLGIALHALDLGHLQAGATVGVFGLGPVGLLLVQLARLAGASQVLATDLLADRLNAARALGARVFEASADEAERGAILAGTGGRGVDLALEAAGNQDAIDTAVAVARPGGRIVLVGIPSEERISFAASPARRKGLTLALSRRMKHTYPRAIRLVESGRVDLSRLVTHRFPLEQSSTAFEVLARRDGLKVLVEPGDPEPAYRG